MTTTRLDILDRSVEKANAVVGAIERDILARRVANVLRARERLLDEIESRYLEDA